jgi:hypothetical protein
MPIIHLLRKVYEHAIGILCTFKKKREILTYPDYIYISEPYKDQVRIGCIDEFRSNNTTRLVQYQKVQVVDVTFPSQITISKNQTIER